MNDEFVVTVFIDFINLIIVCILEFNKITPSVYLQKKAKNSIKPVFCLCNFSFFKKRKFAKQQNLQYKQQNHKNVRLLFVYS